MLRLARPCRSLFCSPPARSSRAGAPAGPVLGPARRPCAATPSRAASSPPSAADSEMAAARACYPGRPLLTRSGQDRFPRQPRCIARLGDRPHGHWLQPHPHPSWRGRPRGGARPLWWRDRSARQARAGRNSPPTPGPAPCSGARTYPRRSTNVWSVEIVPGPAVRLCDRPPGPAFARSNSISAGPSAAPRPGLGRALSAPKLRSAKSRADSCNTVSEVSGFHGRKLTCSFRPPPSASGCGAGERCSGHAAGHAHIQILHVDPIVRSSQSPSFP